MTDWSQYVRKRTNVSSRTVPTRPATTRFDPVRIERGGLSSLSRRMPDVISRMTTPIRRAGVTRRAEIPISRTAGIPTAPLTRGNVLSRPVTSALRTVPATSASPGGGIPALDLGAGLGLGDISSSLTAFSGNIAEQAKNLVPIAVKIVAAAVILKIVLWLVRGRRR